MGQRGALFVFLLVICSIVQIATHPACHTRRDCDKSKDEFCKGDIVNFTLEFGMGGGSSAGIEASDGGACATCTGLERDQCRPPCKLPNVHGWQLEVTFIAVVFSLSIGVLAGLAVLAHEKDMLTGVSDRIIGCLVTVLAPILLIVALLSVNVAGAIDYYYAKRDPFACTPDRLAFDVGLDLCVPYYFQVIAGFVKPLLSILIFPPKKKDNQEDTAPKPEALKAPLLGEEARGCGKSCGDRLRSWKKKALRSPIRIIYLLLAINSFRVDLTDARHVFHSTMSPSMKVGGFLTICISSGNMTALAAFFPLWYMRVLPNPVDMVLHWGRSKTKVVDSYGTVFLIFYLFILSTYTVPLLIVILFTIVTMLAYVWLFLPIGFILCVFGFLAGVPTSRLLRKLHTYSADTFKYKVLKQVKEVTSLRAAVVDERPSVGDLVTIVQEGKLQGKQARITRDDHDNEPYQLIANDEDAKASPAHPFGSVFLQHEEAEGVASYHFDSLENCYISFSNAPREWRLADGSPPPNRKPFTDCVYDAGRKTFTAVVHWDPPANGDVRWEYEMVFAEDFGSIISGRLQSYTGPTTRGRTSQFGPAADLCYVRKGDAKEQAYLVDNSELNAYSEGLAYRLSKNIGDKAPPGSPAAWNSIVYGSEESGGWVRVGDAFLPKRIKGVTVLKLLKEAAIVTQVAIHGTCWNTPTTMELDQTGSNEVRGTGSNGNGMFTVKGTGTLQQSMKLILTNQNGDFKLYLSSDGRGGYSGKYQHGGGWYAVWMKAAMEFTITRDHGGLAGFDYALDDLRVTGVEADGPAYRAGMRQGQIITHVDSVEVTAKNAEEAFAATKVPDRSFTIRTIRVEEIENPQASAEASERSRKYFKEGDVKLVKGSRSDEVQSRMWDELPRQLQELAGELEETDLHEEFFKVLKEDELGVYFIAPLFVPMLAFALPLTARWLNSYGYIESLYMTMMDRHISTYMSGALESSERVVNMAWLLV